MTTAWKRIKRKLLPRTLLGRSLMIILVPVILLQAILSYVFLERHWDTMTDKLIYALAGDIRLIADEVAAARTDAAAERIAKKAGDALDVLVSVENKKGATDSDFPTPLILRWFGVQEKLENTLSRKLKYPFTVSGYTEDRWFDVRVVLPQRVMHVAVHEKRLTSVTTYIFILWMAGSGIALFAIAAIFMRNQIRPIHRLAIAAEKFGKGQDVAHFKVEGASEVRQASRAFLEMKERIKRQIEQRTAMLSGISHDLRTPLTRMKLQMAVVKNSNDISSLREDIEEMEKMIEGYLSFIRGEGSETPEMTDLSSVLDRIVANARRQGFSIEDQVQRRLMIRVRPVAIERAIVNVISNACKYAKHGWVAAYEQSDKIEITVDDDGPGIAGEHREDVFRPFFRAEKSRNKKTGGIGLGLSIAQDIIHAHGGEIFLEDSNRGGLRVVIRLPL